MGNQNGKTECNHKGKWLGLGTVIVTTPKDIILVHNIFCSQCGETKMNSIPIPLPKGSDINIPVFIPGMMDKEPGGTPRSKS